MIVQVLPQNRHTTRNQIKGFILGICAGALIAAASTAAPADLTHDEARQEVLNALEIEDIRASQDNVVLVGTGCGPAGITMVAMEEDEFPFDCVAIEVHQADGPMMHGDHPTDHGSEG